MTRFKTIVCLLICAVILIGTAAILWKDSQHKPIPRNTTIPVALTKVIEKSWQPSVVATGLLVAEKGITLKTETAGRVTGIHFTSGDDVAEGQRLLTLNDAIQQAQVDYAQAQLTQSKHTFDRYRRLIKKNAISKEDYDAAAYTYHSNLAQLNQAKASLSYTIISAPFSGKIGLSNIAIGDYLSEGAEIASLQQLNPMYVDFNIPEIYANRFNLQSKTTVTFNNLPQKVYTGTIVATNSYIDIDTGSLTVRASIPNEDHLLLPGHFSTATLYLDTPKRVLLVPQTAVLYSDTNRFVYKADNNTVKQVIVSTGPQVNQSIIITKGLQKGDTIVSVGGDKLHDGASISIAPKNPAQSNTTQPSSKTSKTTTKTKNTK